MIQRRSWYRHVRGPSIAYRPGARSRLVDSNIGTGAATLRRRTGSANAWFRAPATARPVACTPTYRLCHTVKILPPDDATWPMSSCDSCPFVSVTDGAMAVDPGAG